MTQNSHKIKIAIIGGSGLDDPKILKNPKEIKVKTPYGYPSSKLIQGKIKNKDIVVISRHGKGHIIAPTKVPYLANIWALNKVGCSHILATTACGSLREKIKPKDLVFIDQFIDFTKHRQLTFFENKVVHAAMADPFCLKLRKILSAASKKLKISHHNNGTMVTIEGPRFSTRAESHMFRNLKADVINMSTVPEVILARELGICYAAVAMSTDYDCWKKNEKPVTYEMVLSVMKHNTANVKKLLLETIDKIDFADCSCSQ